MFVGCIVLAGISIVAISYNLVLQKQVRDINQQLEKRLREGTRQPISLSFVNAELTTLGSNINRCLYKAEELQIQSIQDDAVFKEMIANISHDLRTPLTAIKGYLQLLENDSLSLEQQRKVEIMKAHSARLEQMTNTFFEYTYALNTPTPHLEKENVTQLLITAIVSYIPSFEQAGKKIHFKNKEEIFTYFDPEMLQRVIDNLLRNCLLHAKGDVTITLIKNEGVQIRFTNEILSTNRLDPTKMFDRFYTGDTVRSQTTGLGLAIVKELVTKMQGTISATVNDTYLTITITLQ